MILVFIDTDLHGVNTSSIIAIFFIFGFTMACGILVPWPEIEPRPLAVEHGVLTTGPPGNFMTNF